ncbi:M23 family metallopeptidase [Mycolicibacterium mengxianglii]|uniref:M23 family metallopeptidase n=1 Tax=Mycolicibacterium mengxianglii TaxID=2736649 RepID=UPI0018EEFBF5|nr:M23 family metallopeptidase [Mycolicibacterium mengxianglii]
MAQHRSAPSPTREEPKSAREKKRFPARYPAANEVTDIVPFNEFGSLEDFDLPRTAFDDPFSADADVLHAPELDDLHDVDDIVPVRLSRRSDLEDAFVAELHSGYDPDITEVIPRAGQHRKPAASALKGRVMIAAMAAGAAAAAAHSAVNPSDTGSTEAVLAADQRSMNSATMDTATQGIQVVSVSPAASTSLHSEELAKGAAYAQERAEREARLQRPLFVKPTQGIFTSGFGYRWGALHGGVDLANAIGTPIYAVSDGVVIEVGPAAGYGALVKLRHSDGTVTLYGHVNSWNVSVGERVFAGDQIATVGNRGNSTGPHLHLEVLINGTDRIDPVPWLAKRGIGVGSYAG